MFPAGMIAQTVVQADYSFSKNNDNGVSCPSMVFNLKENRLCNQIKLKEIALKNPSLNQ